MLRELDKVTDKVLAYHDNTSNIQTSKNKPSELLRREFLDRLSTAKGKNKYKRYLGSPLRYAGGKSLAVGMIVELLPINIKRLVSPFMGGGAVEIACAKELQIDVMAFDIFDILVNYWDVQVKNPQALANKLKRFESTQKEYSNIKHILKSHWDDKIKLSRMDLASCYYFNHNTGYGPHFLGSQSSVYLQEERYEKMIEKVSSFDAKKLSVKCQSFEKTITDYPDDFIYADPPYYLGEDSKMFVGMYPHRNFPIHHNGFKHELLRDKLLNHKGGFILSYNDCPTIRDWYADCEMSSPKWQYTFGQGDTRIGRNRALNNNGSHIKQSHELLIWRMPQ